MLIRKASYTLALAALLLGYKPAMAGTTLRIARTESKWFIRDGDEAGCLFDLGPDPDGKNAMTVAQTTEIVAPNVVPRPAAR